MAKLQKKSHHTCRRSTKGRGRCGDGFKGFWEKEATHWAAFDMLAQQERGSP